jgi:hypothetical protein
LVYLKERQNGNNERVKIKKLEGPLFVMTNGKKLTLNAIGGIFAITGQRCGFKHEPGSYRPWGGHGMRKYFISTIINSIGDHILADYMAGHKIDDMKRRYWFADPEKLKEKYLKALPYLSLEDVEVHSIQSPEFKKVVEELDKKELRIQRLERYIEEKEGIPQIKKPG